MQAQRICRACGEAKSPDEYYRNAAPRASGLMRECKTCWKARSRRNKRAAAARRDARRAHIQARLDAHDLKVCTRCRTPKVRADFHVSRGRSDGLHSWCKPCQRAGVARSVERHGRKTTPGRGRADARAYVHALKAAPCMDCGGAWPPKVMHFHHRDPAEKTASLAALVSRGAPRDVIDAEAAKCDLLCANCHAIRHGGGT